MTAVLNQYLRNCFWLVVPVLIVNLVLSRYLPPAYQPDIFWHAIPRGLAIPENVLRGAVLFLPIFMPIAKAGASTRALGLGLYAAGLAIYAASWLMLMILPESAWSTSAVGFMAPAWTPVFWLGGISLLADEHLAFRLPCYRRWMFAVLCGAFLVFHNAHAALVLTRLR